MNDLERRQARRLVERLSGWRLVAFLIVAAINFVVIAGLCCLTLDFGPTARSIFLFVLHAQVALVALTVGATRMRWSLKLAIVSGHLVWSLWAVRCFLPGSAVNPAVLDAAVVFAGQAFLLLGGASMSGVKSRSETRRSIQIKDLLIAMSSAAILFPLLQFVLPQLNAGSSLTLADMTRQCTMVMINVFWCAFVLRVALDPSLCVPWRTGQLAKLLISIGLAVTMFFAELAYASLENRDFDLAGRLAFVAWLALSMIPVAAVPPTDRAPARSQEPAPVGR